MSAQNGPSLSLPTRGDYRGRLREAPTGAVERSSPEGSGAALSVRLPFEE